MDCKLPQNAVSCSKVNRDEAMSVKHRITINLENAEYEALQQIAHGTERSLAWLGRKAICDFIEQHQWADVPLLAGLTNANSRAKQSAQ